MKIPSTNSAQSHNPRITSSINLLTSQGMPRKAHHVFRSSSQLKRNHPNKVGVSRLCHVWVAASAIHSYVPLKSLLKWWQPMKRAQKSDGIPQKVPINYLKFPLKSQSSPLKSSPPHVRRLAHRSPVSRPGAVCVQNEGMLPTTNGHDYSLLWFSMIGHCEIIVWYDILWLIVAVDCDLLSLTTTWLWFAMMHYDFL